MRQVLIPHGPYIPTPRAKVPLGTKSPKTHTKGPPDSGSLRGGGWNTLPQTNIAPENQWLEDEIPFGMGAMLVQGEYLTLPLIKSNQTTQPSSLIDKTLEVHCSLHCDFNIKTVRRI